MQIDCHVPVVVRMLGESTQAQLAALEQTVARTVAARLAKAEQVLAERHRCEPVVTPPVRERYEPARDAVNDQTVWVPSYDNDGFRIPLPAHPPAGARTDPPVHVRMLAEASRHLTMDSEHELALLRRVVDNYTCSTNYEAFENLLRRDKLEHFHRGLRRVSRRAPSATLSADTARMLYGPAPEEPDYWRSLSSEELEAPITVGTRTDYLLNDRTEVIKGVGDHADREVVIPGYRWEMTPGALQAFLVHHVGGRLTPFEENLVANWNSMRPVPVFDGPQIVAYHLVFYDGGLPEHRIHDPAGAIVERWWGGETPLVNMGLGPIDYALGAKAGLKLLGLAARGGARIAASAASSDLTRKTLLALKLTTSRLGRPLSAAMEGVEAGLGAPGIGAGGSVPALVARESSAIAPAATRVVPPVTAPRPQPSVQARTVAPERGPVQPVAPQAPAPAGRDVVRVVAVTTVDQTGEHRVTSAPDADREVDESWRQTFDRSPSTATIAPGQGVVTTAPEVAAGFTPDQVAALRLLLGRQFHLEDISVLRRLWDDAARDGDAAILTADNSRHLFDLHRNRFWRRVAADLVARKLFTDAGATFSGGAPYLTVSGQRITITIDHVVERRTDSALALTASNLRLASSRENSVVLRLLNQLDPFLR